MTLLTTHTQRYADWQNAWCRDIGAAIAKIVNPPEYQAVFPDVPTLLVRFWEHEAWQWDTYIRHGYEGGRQHVRDLAPRFRRVQHPHKILETANEPPCNSPLELACLNNYWLGAMEEADAQGIALIIGHIAEGNPAADQGLEGDTARASERWKLEQLVPAVKQAAVRGHILGWHAYWHPAVEGPTGRWHSLGRIQWTIQQFLSMGVPNTLQVVVTEFGIDGLILKKREGWRVLSTPDAYRAGLIEAEVYARGIPQIRGLCLFTVGWEEPWQTYDHDEPFMRSLVAPVRALAQPSQPPAPSEGGTQPIDWARVEAILGEEAQKHIVPLNPNAAFEEAATPMGLVPAGWEFDREIDGVQFRTQAYRQAGQREWQFLVTAVIGQWDRLHWWKRRN